jgi:hypothetical protein
MSTDSLSDSIGDAMRAEEETLASRQIDAFQETFNFCLECRRYTCVSCWNDEPGRCRTCVPVPGVDDIAGFDARAAVTPSLPAAQAEPATGAREEPAWPAEDETVPAAATAATEPEAEPQGVDVEIPTVVPGFAAVPEPALPLAAAVIDDSEPVETAETVEVVEPAIIPRAREWIVPVAPPVRPPVARPAPPPEAAPASLAARQSQLDILGIEDPGQGTVSIGQQEQLPYRSSGAAGVGGSPTLAAVWDASTRALEAGAQRAALRPCGSCGLTVSSTARFCRRCGAPQSLSA